MNQFLIEKHSLNNGDNVTVQYRYEKDIRHDLNSFNGTIYIIYKDYANANGCLNDYYIDGDNFISLDF